MNSAPFARFLWLFCLVSFGAYGQTLVDDTKTLNVLIFEHLEKDKKKMISQGASIRYKLRSAPKVWKKGVLEQIKKGTIVVNGQTVALNNCLLITGRVYGQDGIIGGVAVGVGMSSVIFGSALLGNPVAGVTLLAGGAALLVTGVFLVAKHKRFHLDRGWEVHYGQLTYSLVE
jgi:hypothetical protein